MGANGNRQQTLRSNTTQPYNVGFLNEEGSDKYNVAVYDELNKISVSTNHMFKALDDVNKEIKERTKALDVLNLQVNKSLDKVWFEMGNIKVEIGKSITVNDIIMPDGSTLDGVLEGIQTSINTANGKITTIVGEVTATNVRIDGVITQVDTINGHVSQIIGEINDINGTIQTIQGQVSNAQATASEALTVSRGVNGKYDAQWGVKTNVNGLQGGVGFYNDGTQTSFTVNANSIRFTDGKSPGDYIFYTQNGQTFIKEAVISQATIEWARIKNVQIQSAQIQDGSITNAKIGGGIASDDYNWDTGTGWAINKNGGFSMGGNNGNSKCTLRSDGLSVYDAAGTLRVKVGIF